jgi:tripartite-type tricarboxylate transporter receptor subunit TctC
MRRESGHLVAETERATAGTLGRRALILSAPALASVRPVVAQTWPAGPIRLVVPFEPGGGADRTARVLAAKMQQVLGQPMVVENRAGAGGTVGTMAVLNAPADGNTVLYGTPGQLVTNPMLVRDLPYNAERDFIGVTMIHRSAHLLVVHPAIPANSVAELVALARARPGDLTFASAGIGGTSHISGEMLAHLAGIDILHVPFRGTAPAAQALLAGQISMQIDTPEVFLPLVAEGKLRALATSGAERSAAFPQLPTIGETVPGFDSTVFNYIAVRRGVPPQIVARLNEAFGTVLRMPDVRQQIETGGRTVLHSTPAELDAILAAERVRLRALIARLAL